ncbi:MAG TPA: hypothetical protein VNM66_05090, partial [Thermodesulfobacteriota bacterium]|nr:hypothetical protein [Thermodesulfobacteriota bacterium]
LALVRAERVLAGSGPSGEPPAAFDRLVVGGRVAPLVELPAPGGLGRQPRAWVASLVADGAWRLVFKQERGPCVFDCAEQRYWYFTVSASGEPHLVGTYAVAAGGGRSGGRSEGTPRWGFPGEEERRLLAAARAAAGP